MDSTAQGLGVDLGKRLKGLLLRRSSLAVGLQGAAGIGKTHTAQALLRQTPCPSFSLHSTAPLGQWVAALPKPKTLELWAERILERLAAGEPLGTANAANALGTLLARLAPVVLYLEDIHEASAERLELITRLAEIVQRSKGVGLLLTSRNALPEPIEAVQLEPLSPEGSQTLLETQAGTELPPEAVEWIFSKAAGNPLFSLEYFRHLARAGNLWNDGQRWRWREPERRLMPSTVEALVERTLTEASKFPMQLQKILEAKAILGLNTDQRLWSAVADLGPEDLEAEVQALEGLGILRAGEFAHPLYGEVLIHNLPSERRRALARRALEVYGEDPPAAAGFVEDAGLEAAQALEVLEAAVQATRKAGSPLQAARLLAQAAQHATGLERAQLALEAAQGLRQADLPRAIQLAEMAGLEPTLEVQAAVLVAEILAVQGRLAEAEQRLEHLSIPALERPALRLTLHGLALDFAGVLSLWQETPELQAGLDPRVVRAVVQALFRSGRVGEARPLLDQALLRDTLSAQDRLALEGHQVTLLSYEGKYEAAAGLWAERALRLRALGDLIGAARALYNQGVMMERLMRLGLSIDLNAQAARLYLEAGDLRSYTNTLIGRAWDLWHLAEYQEAETLLLEARTLLQGMDASDNLVECEGVLSLLYLDWSPPLAADLAAKHASAAVELARRLNTPNEIVVALYDLVMARLRQGRPEAARELVEEMVALREGHRLKGMGSNTLYCRAMVLEALGQPDQALTLMQEAESMQRGGGEILLHKIGIEVARMSGDLAMARRHLEWFQTHRILCGVDILRRYFPELAAQPETVSGAAELRLEALGPMQIVREGQGQPVRGQKRRELLALLLESRLAGRREVSKLDLLEALYPDTDELQASTALKDLVYALRELYGPAVIQTTEGGYALGEVESDAEAFLRGGDTRLWRGAYLEGLGLEGDANVREALYLSLQSRAEGLLESDPNEAARVGQLLLEADPYAPEYLRLTLSALHKAKYYKGLSRTYARARERMNEVGQNLPDSWQAFVDKNP